MSRRRTRRPSPASSPTPLPAVGSAASAPSPSATEPANPTPPTASAEAIKPRAPRLPAAAAPNPPSLAPAPTAGAATLATELRGLVDGLLFLSESEAPFTLVELPKDAILPDALRTLAKLPPDAPSEEWTVADVLSPFTSDDQPDAARFAALRKFLEEKLGRAVVYKLGAVKKPVFLLGRQPDKSWLGVQTEAVET